MPAPTEASEDAARFRWRLAVRREMLRWSDVGPCAQCGEWVGHFGGSTVRDPCSAIPLDVPLEEVRRNCYVVRRHWIGDAIRSATKDHP